MLYLMTLSVLSGVLLPLALPNEIFLFGFPLLGCVCLAPYFFAIARCPSWKKAALCSVLFALVSTPLGNFWLAFFKDFAFLTIGSVTLAYSFLFIGYGTVLWRFSKTQGRWRPFLIAAFWTVYEFIKSTGYFAYPWGLISYPVNTLLPLLQVADIAGIWPISFLMAFINALAAESMLRLGVPRLPAVPRFPARTWLFAASLVLIFTGYGLFRMAAGVPSAGGLKAVLVQQNTDPWGGSAQEKSLLLLEDMSRRGVADLGGEADIVLWSESSVSSPYAINKNRFETFPRKDPFGPFVRSLGANLFTGNTIQVDGRRHQNGVILINTQGDVTGSYGKRHPVPIAEHVPFWEFAPVREFFQKKVGLGSIWELGKEDTIFTIKTSKAKDIRFGAPICFEDAFPYLCRGLVLKGADLLVNLTNDAWSQTNSAQIQHFVVARFRSIEMKRVLVRSTNGGLTAIVGPFGEIRQSLPMFEAAYLATEIPVFREEGLTPYTVFGDWLPVLLGIILLVALVRGNKKAAHRDGL
ncbi:MAG: apolipoprotein N-acyltransferase [Spirochaetales bacterium]|jgi:apolipoprotein N-acyltransferase|nr:apolipoprotein N-acyltransferase [Spirochaetales bacterium]